ncbi:MAG: hypothetical protein ABFC77_14895 [Thermoguttaceae bacterium]
MMSCWSKNLAVAALGVFVCAPLLNAAEPGSSAATSAPRMLILRNGQTLEGKITENADGYVVDLGDGQIWLKTSDVDLVCESLEDGYRRKRARISTSNAPQHLELAQWCLRRGLLGNAAAELADAAALDPGNPMLGVLQERLKLAMEPPEKTSHGVQASAGPTNEDLDRTVRSLPRGSVETFTQLVQPVLMNHCASGSCHGSQSDNTLRLLRVPSNKLAGRRITQRNLYAVLAFVDRDNPANSRLLTSLVGPHGTAKNGIFVERQAMQYQRLSDWTRLLAQQPADETIATIAPPGTPADRSPPKVLSQEAQRASPLMASRPSPNVKRGVAALNRPTDPMDPEVFNRRFAPKKNPSDQPEDSPKKPTRGD